MVLGRSVATRSTAFQEFKKEVEEWFTDISSSPMELQRRREELLKKAIVMISRGNAHGPAWAKATLQLFEDTQIK